MTIAAPNVSWIATKTATVGAIGYEYTSSCVIVASTQPKSPVVTLALQ
jgi:hypothetical protein